MDDSLFAPAQEDLSSDARDGASMLRQGHSACDFAAVSSGDR
jgi:hypothetical protein